MFSAVLARPLPSVARPLVGAVAFRSASCRRLSLVGRSLQQPKRTPSICTRTICRQQSGPASNTTEAASSGGFSYIAFAKTYPAANNLIIATIKTSAADLVAQCAIERKSFSEIDWKRNAVFCLFGAAYLGCFQYWYQVNVFKRLFPNVERFTSQPWAAKLSDVPGLISLAGQCAIDIGVLSLLYLPTFYCFKEFVYSDSWSPMGWFTGGTSKWMNNFSKDVPDVFKVWLPADLVCFSVPLFLRLPVRHVVSFVWTAYLSFVRGAK